MKKELKNVKKHLEILRKVGNSFKDIYDVTFSNGNRVLFEYDENHKSHTVTFNEADVTIKNVANNLIKTLNGTKGEFIALNLDTSKEWVYTFWAILMSGNKPFLVNLRQPKPLTKKFIDQLGITKSIDYENNEFGLESIRYSSLLGASSTKVDYDFGDEIALATSGTSMVDKICIYSGKELIAQIQNSESIIDDCPKVQSFYHGHAKFLAFLPFYHIFGLEAVYLWFSFFGYPIVFLEDYSPETILNTIKNHEVTHVISVPLFWEEIAKAIRLEVSKRDEKTKAKFEKAIAFSNKIQRKNGGLGLLFAKIAFKEIRKKTLGDSVLWSVSGGSFLKDDTLRLMNALGYNLRVGYGATEIGITSLEVSEDAAKRNLNSVGKPVKTVEYDIRDGELFVKGQSTCKKIIINGEHKTIDEWFATGDLAKKDSDGRYYILGRKSDIVIGDNGENINPDDIEKFFAFKENVLNFSVLGINNQLSIVLEVSSALPFEEMNEIEELVKKQNEIIDLSMQVKKIFFTHDHIMNPNAIKVSRKYILKNIETKSIKIFELKDFRKNNLDIENNEIYSKLIKLFSEATFKKEEEITPDSNFVYDLGGNSFEYYGLIAAIYEEFDIKVSPNVEKPPLTIREIATLIEEYQKQWNSQLRSF